MVLLKCGSVIVLSLLSFNSIETAPMKGEDVVGLLDDWDYKIQPHGLPLLTISTKMHILPPDYTYDQDLKVDGLKPGSKKDSVRIPKKIGDVVRSKMSCGACTLGIGLLQKEIIGGSEFDVIKTKFIALCFSFKVASELICGKTFDIFGPELIAAYNASALGPKEACSLIFGEICTPVENELHEWGIELPGKPKPTIAELGPSEGNFPVFKVLHLSDTHFDPDYAVGSPANCEEPLCCRNYSTPSTKKPTTIAGRWGAYDKCDSPKILIENMLKNIALEHADIDYIIWTGDLPPHDIWNQSRESNSDIIKECVRQMFEFFPNTPIFPALGNHESVPAGSFAPPWMKEDNHSINWLYTTVADQWSRWLPSTSTNTVLHGGFYSVLLRPGFRLISLNTNYCYTLSWWLLVNSTDPAQELKWLTHELQEAENNGEKVHLIGHVPPGNSDCMKVWSRNFYSIVERYENTITAQFYGHTHADEFELFYETSEYSRPTSIAYLGPSVTTYENFNPAYRIYYVDGDHELSTREVLDHETWTMDLTKANMENDDPKWYKLYSAKDAYQLKSLTPVEWNKLIDRMVSDEDLFHTFYRNYYRDSPVMPSCDLQCKLQILCDLKSGRSHDRRHLCHDLEYSIGL